MADLTPRIRELRARIDELDGSRSELIQATSQVRAARLDAPAVMAYVADLKALLSTGTILEQKSFIRSFVSRVDYSLPRLIVDYTIPMKTKRVKPFTRGVLPLDKTASLIIHNVTQNVKWTR